MIIACPACATRYVVPDSAIGIEGRTVRCAKCKHSWFQDGPDADRLTEAPVPTPAPDHIVPRADPVDRPSKPEAAPGDQSFRDEAPDFDEAEPPYGEVQNDLPPPPEANHENEISRFDHSPPFRPRRNITKLWTWAAALFALLAIGTIVAVNYTGMPAWMPVSKPLFGAAQPNLQLEFPVEEQERRTLPNGTEFFGARIVVTNTARESREVPPVLIVLRDQRERQVYSWVVEPPQANLSPGEELTINEAVTDVPKSAVFADIGWAPR